MIIDSHIHCGKELPFERIAPLLQEGGIDGVCLFSPVEDIYDRYDFNFKDSPEWQLRRREANRYLRTLSETKSNIFPYFFVWNDFDIDELSLGYKGIKWHRHEDEPVYNYSDNRCRRLIDKIVELKLPIVFEESYSNTLYFINKLAPDAIVIIPHLGMLNGGFFAIDESGIWNNERIYTDSSLASSNTINAFLNKYGSHKLLFGSDFPFGRPASELRKILSLKIPDKDKGAIVGGNILRLLSIKN